MKKSKLTSAVATAKNETAEAILIILDSIESPGQRKKTAKKAKVKTLMERYGIEYED